MFCMRNRRLCMCMCMYYVFLLFCFVQIKRDARPFTDIICVAPGNKSLNHIPFHILSTAANLNQYTLFQ